MSRESQEAADLYDQIETEAGTAREDAQEETPVGYLEEWVSFVKSAVAKATRPSIILTDREVLQGDLSSKLSPQLVELVESVRAVIQEVKELEEESARLKVVKQTK